jgi:hypothetical protein
LVPYLGGIPLGDLSAGDVQGMFTAIMRHESTLGHPVCPATLHWIHATLRAALNGSAGRRPTARSSDFKETLLWRRCGPASVVGDLAVLTGNSFEQLRRELTGSPSS